MIASLLNLPIELQCQIYSYVVGGHYITIDSDVSTPPRPHGLNIAKRPTGRFSRCETHSGSSTACRHASTCKKVPCRFEIGILSVCRAIAIITQPMLYSQNSFFFSFPFDLLFFIKHQVEHSGTALNTQCVRDVHLGAPFLHPLMKSGAEEAFGTYASSSTYMCFSKLDIPY